MHMKICIFQTQNHLSDDYQVIQVCDLEEA